MCKQRTIKRAFASVVHDVMKKQRPHMIRMSVRYNTLLRGLLMSSPKYMYGIIGGRAAYRKHWQLEGPR